MDFFGFEIKRKDEKQLSSFVEPTNDDAAISIAAGISQSAFVDLDGSAGTEAELIVRYRSMLHQPEIQQAIDDIVNESITITDDDFPIVCVTDDIPFSDGIKKKIRDEFQLCLELLDFSNQGYEIFQKWYVDGRLNYHAVVDQDNLKEGIRELRYIDPRKLRKIREYEPVAGDKNPGIVKRIKEEYFLYSDTGFGLSVPSVLSSFSNSIQGLKINKDEIVHCNSGILNEKNTAILSHLHKAFKPLNQLRMMENSLVIYRISRAPERRIFYIDVGNLPKLKAEQYLRDMMTNHKNKVSYDASTGEIKDDRRFMTITDDFWLPRREGGKGTEITTLPGGQNLGEMDDVLYFQKKLFKALNVPISRLEADSVFNTGRSTEITRDEVKFAKFIKRLRQRFAILFDHILEKQLVLKGIIKHEEWQQIKNKIRYDFISDNKFDELLESETMRDRLSTLDNIQQYVGIYFSKDYVRKNVLMMNEQEIDDNKKEMTQESIDDPNLEDGEQSQGTNNGPPPN